MDNTGFVFLSSLVARFPVSENSYFPRVVGQQVPGWIPQGEALLCGLKMEEKQKHCPLASWLQPAEAKAAGCGRSSICGFQEALVGHHPLPCQAVSPSQAVSCGQLRTIPISPDFLIFAFPASNSLHETFSKYLRWLLFS